MSVDPTRPLYRTEALRHHGAPKRVASAFEPALPRWTRHGLGIITGVGVSILACLLLIRTSSVEHLEATLLRDSESSTTTLVLASAAPIPSIGSMVEFRPHASGAPMILEIVPPSPSSTGVHEEAHLAIPVRRLTPKASPQNQHEPEPPATPGVVSIRLRRHSLLWHLSIWRNSP